jgi:hypothetical protein
MIEVSRLDSWKQIATYLDRNVRTVQRWEKREGLPVHRQFHEKAGSVHAFRQEIDAWRNSRSYRMQLNGEALHTSPRVANHIFDESEQLVVRKLLEMILVQLTVQPSTPAVSLAPKTRSQAEESDIVNGQKDLGSRRDNVDGNSVQSHSFLPRMQ